MSRIWEMEEVNEYCDLFQTYRQAMLDAGFNIEDFNITITKKEIE